MLTELWQWESAAVSIIIVHRVLMKENRQHMWTRKLCCRKDDRAMRPIGYMDELNFRDSLTTPTATIPNIFYGLLFRSTLW